MGPLNAPGSLQRMASNNYQECCQNHALYFQLNERCLGTMILPRAHNAQPKSNASVHLLEISHSGNFYCLAYCMLQLMLALADREGSQSGIY